MAGIRGRKIIKANIINDNTFIHAFIAQNDKKIKGNISSNPSATTTQKGIIRIATDEEAIDGLSEDTVITPHTLRLVTNYVHEQGIASDTWVINHNLNKRPSFVVVDSAYAAQLPSEVIYNTDNQMTMIFISSFSGFAYLN